MSKLQQNGANDDEFLTPTQREYTIENLSPGVEYSARMSVCKDFEGVTYRSKPVNIAFKTDVDEGEFPP